MSQSPLHEFDLALCAHVRTNLRVHLHGLAPDSGKSDRAASVSRGKAGRGRADPYRRYINLSPADGFALWLADTLPPNLWSHLREAETPSPLLADEHFEILASVLEVMPPILQSVDWIPLPPLHANYSYCLPQIRQKLAETTAEQFAVASAAYAGRLEAKGVRIWEGIRITREWVGEVRHLLRAMGMVEQLPRPEGRQPTPDDPEELFDDGLTALVELTSHPGPPSHSPDFTTVNWFDTHYVFSKGNQAESVRVLWEAWEHDGHGLSQESIGEAIGSDAERFDFRKIFRKRRGHCGKGYDMHPAWGTMIQSVGKGIFKLVPPPQAR